MSRLTTDYLRTAYQRRAGYSRLVLQLISDPSFDPTIILEITWHPLYGRENPVYYLHKMEWDWDRETDELAQTGQLPHSIEEIKATKYLFTKSVLIDDQFVQALMEKFSALHIPPFIPNTLRGGVDGTYHEIIMVSDWDAKVHFFWWSHRPSQWQPLFDVYDEVFALLDQTVASKEAAEAPTYPNLPIPDNDELADE